MSIEKVKEAVRDLESVNAKFEARALSSVQHSGWREHALAKALRELAGEHGVTLHGNLSIDSRGEFRIVAARSDGRNPDTAGCAEFGEGFAAILSRHNPRTGVSPGATIIAQNGWCYMNHFDVERMVTEVAHQQEAVVERDTDEEQSAGRGAER